MISRNDVVLLGLTSSVMGALISGLMFGLGALLVVEGANIGWLLIVPAAPVSGTIGWILGRRLAAQIGR